MLNLALIGYGGMGKYHANTLITPEPNVKIIGVFDIDDTATTQAKSDGYDVYDCFSDVLTDANVDAVLIVTPNDTHRDIAIAALKAGKHVLCEKPVMMNTGELQEVLEVAMETGNIFYVHQNRRWDEDFLIIKNLYENKQIGDLFRIESRVHGANGIPGDWRHLKAHGGGMVLDWGVHIIDQLYYLIDSPLKSVSADLSFVLGDECDDGFTAIIKWQNGVEALIEVGTTNFVKLPRWYVKGLEGTALIADWDMSGEMVVRGGSSNTSNTHSNLTPIQAGVGLTKTMAPPSEDDITRLELPKPAYQPESIYENFYRVITEDAKPIVKNQQVYEVLSLIEDIFEAAETQTVIKY
ncbi:MAG: Gfo/Idh/MocA family oxidoreductase [Clostridiales Family XIII bacterium]|jgi:predicted dehydrogenase|nr:Gfo/Idh/MocA family oxidoreductase [Clostridiales Family XIII bacterium]